MRAATRNGAASSAGAVSSAEGGAACETMVALAKSVAKTGGDQPAAEPSAAEPQPSAAEPPPWAAEPSAAEPSPWAAVPWAAEPFEAELFAAELFPELIAAEPSKSPGAELTHSALWKKRKRDRDAELRPATKEVTVLLVCSHSRLT